MSQLHLTEVEDAALRMAIERIAPGATRIAVLRALVAVAATASQCWIDVVAEEARRQRSR